MFDKKDGESADSLIPANTGVPSQDEKEKYAAETAAAEFISYCEANDIDHDESSMKTEDAEGFRQIKEHFIKACRAGRVIVDETKIIYRVSERSGNFAGDHVTINRPGGQAFMAMDGFKDNESVHKLQAFCSAMTGKEVRYFSKLDIVDWRFFRDISSLFLSA
ncbi:hypothetical protein FACS1894161_2540 [Spirochaetia bacterium]|nr:hypothetical protein FACS1894161_2540 [Spirochaetia bacterium]